MEGRCAPLSEGIPLSDRGSEAGGGGMGARWSDAMFLIIELYRLKFSGHTTPSLFTLRRWSAMACSRCAEDATCAVCERRAHFRDANFWCWVEEPTSGFWFRCCRICHDSVDLSRVPPSLYKEYIKHQLLLKPKLPRQLKKHQPKKRKKKKLTK